MLIPNNMASRRSRILPALAASFLAAAAVAAPNLSPKILQCNGSYSSGNPLATHAPPSYLPGQQVAVDITSPDGIGLRVGRAPMAYNSTATDALWRFDNATNDVTVAGTLATCNPSCGNSCAVTSPFTFTYSDPDRSPTMSIGVCNYTYNASRSYPCSPQPFCSGGCDLTVLPTTLAASTIPVGLSACPASPPAAGATTLPFTASTNFPNDPNNGAATFNGTTQYGTMAYVAGSWMDLGPTYTLSAWIKTSANVPGLQTILETSNVAQYWGFGLFSNTLMAQDSRGPEVGVYGPQLNDGLWHKVDVVRVNGYTKTFYVDGNPVGAVVVASTDSFSGHTIGAPVSVGAQDLACCGPTVNSFFNGQIDEIRVDTAALSAADILLEFWGTQHQYSSNGGGNFAAITTGTFSGGTPASGVTTLVTYFPGDTPTTNSEWIFEAQNVQTVSTVLSQVGVSLDTKPPVAPIPVPATTVATSTSDVSWTWGAPSEVCYHPAPSPFAAPYYQFVDAASGAVLNPPGPMYYDMTIATGVVEHLPGGTNQLATRRLLLTDFWGTSTLSASATTYALALPPVSPTTSAISTGSFVFSWNPNGNPGYTRYEVVYGKDPAFVVGVSTPASLGSGFTGTAMNITGLTTGTTYYARVRAFSGRASDYYGGVPTASTSTSVVTQPGAPTLSATATSNSAILWSWTPQTGVTGYTLYDSPTQAVLFGPNSAGLAYTSNGLAVNSRYDAEVAADVYEINGSTAVSARGHAFTYTFANPPLSPSVSAVYTSSAAFAWDPDGNPSYTIYQVVLAVDPLFASVVSTLSVAGSSTSATGLLPGATYYSRVQAVSGAQYPTGFTTFPPLTTAVNPAISASSAPASPYSISPGLAGSWQFDESTGTITRDLSGNDDNANFACLPPGCASTPIWAAGPPGLGTAASFSGLAGGVVLTSANPLFGTGAGSLSIEAWVYPQTLAQPSGAGIVGIGPQNSEDFALDVAGAGALGFLTSSAGAEEAVVSTAAVVAGQWTHAAGVYDSVQNTSTLYLNGRPAAVLSHVPPRAASGSGTVLAIGNRQNASGSYAAPFFGRIDAVRLFSTALTASQVLSDYLGSFVSSVTSSGGVIVALPPDAFGVPAEIYISGDPVNDPIRVTPAALAAGRAAPPAGMTMVPGTLVEVVAIVNGLPFTAPLGSSATVTIPFLSAGNVVTGTNPPLAAGGVRMFTLDTSVNAWDPLPTTVDLARNRASGVTPHFSVFALFAPASFASGVSTARAYPVPWKPGTGGRFDAAGVTFANLPLSGTIRILTLSGQHVVDLSFNGASAGALVWNGLNTDGYRTASGVYFAKVQSDADGSTVMLKFAIER